MRYAIILFILVSAVGSAAEPGSSLPLFFFPNAAGFGLEAPGLHASFQPGSVLFQIHERNLRLRFLRSDPGVEMEGMELAPGKVNFLIGNRVENWKQDIPTYRKVLYRGLYPGIDLTYAGAVDRIKSEFTVAPGADPDRIKLEYPEADSVSVSGNGDLIVKSAEMELREEAPEIYQESGGRRVRIDGHYRVLNPHTVGFEIGVYDGTKPLVIDPVISYATYLGGGSMSAVTGLAADGSGNLYIAGWTEAHDFPVVGAEQASNQGGVDAFIAKMNATGTALVYATYVGGLADDRAAGIALDSSGEAYVTGSTSSKNFPLSAAVQSRLGGSRTAFALKLNAAGNSLLFSTYLGGSNYDLGNAIAVDGSGNAYIAGDTYSTDFPVLHPLQSSLSGQDDAFVTKLTSAGKISFSTFLGGAGSDHAGGIAVDSSANVYVAGGTFSTNFPVVAAIQGFNAGGQDAFVAKINSSGSAIVYSTYLGGSGGNLTAPEQVNSIAVDATGAVYVTGSTNSSNFPLSASAFQHTFGGIQDAFVAKINAAGNTLAYSTYLGGSSSDWGSGIAVDAGGNAYVAGYTLSADFPMASAVQTTSKGMFDGFVSELGPAGNALLFSTYYGGSGSDNTSAIALDAGGNIYTGGQTNSFDLPLQGPIQSNNNAGSTGFVMRLGVGPQAPQTVSVTPSSGNSASQTFKFVYFDLLGTSDLLTVQALFNSTLTLVGGCYITVNPASGTAQLANDANTAFLGPITLGTPATLQNSQCTIGGTGSSLAGSGSTLTVNLAVTFSFGFAGAKTTYGYAQTAGGLSSGWQSLGTWTVPGGAPQAVSVTPSSGTGAVRSFSLVYSDPAGAADLATVLVLFNTAIAGANACYVNIDTRHGTLSLVNDAATVGLGPITVGTSATLQNSQCLISAAGSSVNASGNVLTVILAVTFQSAFAGAKNIFGFAQTIGGLNSGWQSLGTWTVPGGAPQAISVSPSSGNSFSQSFTLLSSDPAGALDLATVLVLFNTAISTPSACYVNVDALHGTLALVNDAGTAGLGPITIGTSATLQNSQCTVSAAGSSVKSSGNVLTVIVAVTFQPAFAGTKNTYSLVQTIGGLNSGWQSLGTWTVSGGPPQAISVSPSSGNSFSQSFTLLSSDPAGALDLATVLVLFNTAISTPSACYVNVDALHGTLALVNDAGTAGLGPITIGTSATLQNSQCTVSAAGSSVKSSGNVLTVVVAVTFQPAFAGIKNDFSLVQTIGGLNSGWQTLGTFTIP